MKKVGIMGGTFNPIHKGHLMLAKQAFEQYTLDEVLFMPCGVPYMKAGQNVEPGPIRAKMTALAIQDMPGFALSTIEIEKKGNTYTYETLKQLTKDNPDTEYYFIVGADSLFHMTKWVHPEHIFDSCCILAAVRDDKTDADMEKQIQILQKEYGADIRLLQINCMNISSSDIRQKIAAGESIEEEVPEQVRQYIERKGLYR